MTNTISKIKGMEDSLSYKPEQSLDLKQYFNRIHTQFDPDLVLKAAKKEIEDNKGMPKVVEPDSNLFKAMTLSEFHEGMLMNTTIPDQYGTFAVRLMRDIEQDFNCQTKSQKATAELAVISYVRFLEAQRRFNNVLSTDSAQPYISQFLSIMSKEIDRAIRHYLTAIQILNTMNQPQLKLTLKADTAIVGQNQIVQTNHE